MPITIEKAIEIKEETIKTGVIKDSLALLEADMLSIEALKRVKACRPVDLYAPEILLPGEARE